MTVPNASAFLADPQGQITQLVEIERSRAFDMIPELLDELETTGISKDDKKSLSQGILSLLAEWYCQRIPAYRKDWLYAEHLALFILNGLYWVAYLHSNQATHRHHREQVLTSFISRFQGNSLLEAVLNAPDQRQQADQLILLVLATIRYLRSQYSKFEVAGEGMLIEFEKAPERIRFWPPEVATDETKNEVLKKVVESVTTLPNCLGLLLVGSFAAEYKWDEFGDLDICCFCSEEPDAAMHASIVDSLTPKNHDTYGVHLYLDFGNTSIHLEFATQSAQDRYFKQLGKEGIELPFINVSSDEYALSAYGWSIGRILFDPDGFMSTYKENINQFPDAMKRVLAKSWASLWQHGSASYAHAQEQRDQISALTALHFCWEAAIRMLMVRHEIYGNPHSPKWIPAELANLPQYKEREMRHRLDLLQIDAMAPLEKRCEYATALWEAISPEMR